MVITGLMYARLIGRLAFALRFTKSIFPERRKKKAKSSAQIISQSRSEEKTEEVFTQPSESTPINTPYDGELSGYDVKLEDDPVPRRKKRLKAEVVESEDEPKLDVPPISEPEPERESRPRRKPPRSGEIEKSRVWTDEDDEETTAYDVHDAVAVPVEHVEKVEKIDAERVEEETKLLRRDDVPKRPKVIWGPELLAFLGQSGTVSAIVIATGLCSLAGVMVRVARMFNPVAGAGPD